MALDRQMAASHYCRFRFRQEPTLEILTRLWQRSLIFALGIFSVWLIVFVVFETADRRLPWILSAGVTYAIAAYVILP